MNNNFNIKILEEDKLKSERDMNSKLSKKRNREINDNFSLFKSNENLDKFLRLLISCTNVKTEKILIMGAMFGKELDRFFELFPESQFFITDKSKSMMNSIKEKYEIFENSNIYVVNAFDGSSLLDFLLKHGKFDLVIASRLNVYSPNKEQLLHFHRFIYKHYLKKNAIFSIIIHDQDTWLNCFKLLKKKKPFLNEIINIKNSENPVHIIFYKKNKKLVSLGG